jgi:hypothetical protein
MYRKELRHLIQQEIARVKEDYLIPKEEVPDDFARVVDTSDSDQDDDDFVGMDYLGDYPRGMSRKLSCGECGGVLVMEGGCGCGTSSGDMMMAVTPGYMQVDHELDSDHHDMTDHHEGAYMAKSQLHKIEKYAAKIQHMIPHGHDLEDWMRTKISQAADDLGEVYHKLEYQTHLD